MDCHIKCVHISILTICEIISLDSKRENIGIGTALLKEIEKIAIDNNCKKMRLVTTNDNMRALQFYQKRVNYILDEFVNFIIISLFSNMLTVVGDRRIRFNLFLQSFSQIENKYGKDVAENIRDNCQTCIYLKTASNETASVISKNWVLIQI